MINFLRITVVFTSLLLANLILVNPLSAQPCITGISTFPYNEDFENSDGNWTPGGTSSDWAWGSPSKALIDIAGGGINSWITGGLTNGSYNANENSWLQSPCFDFTSLTTPQIQFKLYWETERRLDGAALQYSINDGINWSPVGTIASNANCLGQNWYNTSAVTALSGSAGWSGTILPDQGACLGGNGSGTWITARHDLSLLAGAPKVLFRFVFSSGSTCNGYDGFAIDDILITEGLLLTADFSYACLPDKIVDFTNTSSCATGSVWDFGDPTSGANNVSNQKNSSHQFSNPGTYNISLTSSFATGTTSTISKQITVLEVAALIDQPLLCNGDANGVLSVTATGSTNPYSYSWNTNPTQSTQTITNISAGTYTVTVNSGNACTTAATIVLQNPDTISGTTIKKDEQCSTSNGSIITSISGGTMPYSYLWNNGATSASITQIPAGLYTLQITDANLCKGSISNIEILNLSEKLPVNLGKDSTICPGQIIILNPGTFANYLWQDNSTAPTFTVRETGKYKVIVSNGAGCSGTDSISILVNCSDIYFPSAFTPNNDGLNDWFGPLGNFSLITKFQLFVYNRFGQLVFESNNPNQKWNGNLKEAKQDISSFVWVANYTIDGIEKSKKGGVTLIR